MAEKTYIYGRNTVRASLEEKAVKVLYVAPNFNEPKILSLAKENAVNVTIKDVGFLSKLVHGGVHQGVVAEVESYAYAPLQSIIEKGKTMQFPLVLMLSELNDPHNLGAIIRTADAFGVAGIIIKKDNQVGVTPTVLKIATGAHLYVPIAQVTNLNQTVETLKKSGYWIVATDAQAQNSYRDVKYDMPVCLIVGSEGFGIAPLLMKNADFTIKLPLVGHVNSLNASVATATIIALIRHLQSTY